MTTNEEVATTTRFPPSRLVMWALIAVLFTLVQVRGSMYGGRLALPPTFDDVGYMHDGLVRLKVLFDQGPVSLLKHAVAHPPHSPFSSLLAVSGYVVFGLQDWVPAATNGLIIFGVLWWLALRVRCLPLRWQLIIAGLVLTWPLMGQSVVNFRPDLACGLTTAWCAFYIVRCPWIGARQRQYAAGVGLGIAILMKPAISPVTALIVLTALAAATLTDIRFGTTHRSGRSITAGWARCLGTATLVVAPYAMVATGQTWAYIYRNTFGRMAEVWKRDLSTWKQALYYLNGEGGRFALDTWLVLWVVLAVAAALAAYARSDRTVFTRLPAISLVFFVSYLSVTLPAHKHAFLGAVVPSLMLLSGIEMMVYLAADRNRRDAASGSPNTISTVGRMLLVALLVIGAVRFQWPVHLTPGGAVPRQEMAQHRQLLEDFYRDVRRFGEGHTLVVFNQIGQYLNGAVLEYRAALDGLFELKGRHGLDLGNWAPFEEEFARADLFVFFSPDNPNVLRWLPDAGEWQPILDGVREDPGFVLAATYPTPVGGEVLLYMRKGEVGGVGASAGEACRVERSRAKR